MMSVRHLRPCDIICGLIFSPNEIDCITMYQGESVESLPHFSSLANLLCVSSDRIETSGGAPEN